MRKTTLVLTCLLSLSLAEEWLFSGFIRLTVYPTDLGIARAFAITTKQTFQSKITLKTRVLETDKLEILFINTESRYLANDQEQTPDIKLSDNLVTRHLILEKGPNGYQFFDDPDHVLSEVLSFDPNLLCLLLNLALSPNKADNSSFENEPPLSTVWSMSYTNQDHYRTLERMTATLNRGLGENQAFSVSVNRDEILHTDKTIVSAMADGLGDGMISRHSDGQIFLVNATVHLERSLYIKENQREGRLSISEEQDFVLEPKP